MGGDKRAGHRSEEKRAVQTISGGTKYTEQIMSERLGFMCSSEMLYTMMEIII